MHARRCGFNSRTREGCDALGVSATAEAVEFQFTHPRGVRRQPSSTPQKRRWFQFTHPRGVRLADVASDYLTTVVSIHAPARGATRFACNPFSFLAGFNSRTREGCDYRLAECYQRDVPFQFTHPRGVRLGGLVVRLDRRRSFNSRTREGCDDRRRLLPTDNFVSIHAPARGATRRFALFVRARAVSIHAPARGATPTITEDGAVPSVSIHAPARGATGFSTQLISRKALFQFTHPRGVRRRADGRRRGAVGFNSRTREGCDQGCGEPRNPKARFNSRTREGCDAETQAGAANAAMFQFTHPRGVRQRGNRKTSGGRNRFNSRTREGCDDNLPLSPLALTVSIHAPARGATKIPSKYFVRAVSFQFTHPRGVRPNNPWGVVRPESFNSRTREGCD